MTRNVLWADDDCDRLLAPLGRILRAHKGLSLSATVTYREAVDVLDGAKGVENAQIHSLLVDIILPYDREGRGALMSDLGIKLADRAAAEGVATIAFLTVVRRDEVADKFSELQKSHPTVHFGYFDKTELLAGEELKKLIELLASARHSEEPENAC